MNIKLYHIIILLTLTFGAIQSVSAQEEVYESDVIRKKGVIYYEGKKYTGWLLSDQDGIPNKCNCIMRAAYKNGRLNGIKKLWYKNGVLKYSGSYYRGYKSGTHYDYYSNGNTKLKTIYKKGGVVHKIYFRDDGSRKKYEKYVKGELVLSKKCTSDLTGDCIDIFNTDNEDYNNETDNNEANKDLINNTTIIMSNDTLDIEPPKLFAGTQKILYPDLSVRRVILYQDALIAIDSLFYKSRIPQNVKIFEEGELKQEKIFNNTGILIEEINKKNSKLDGEQLIYYETGKLKQKKIYDNDELKKEILYFENGSKSLEKVYENGKTKEKTSYNKNGEKTFVEEHSDGRIITSVYKENKKNKKIFYDNSGKREKEEDYDDTEKLVKTTTFNIDTGSPKESVTINNNQKIYITYNEKGNKKSEKDSINIDGKPFLIREGSYKKNKKQGKWFYYTTDRKSEIRNEFDNGNLVKTDTIYYDRLVKNRINEKNSNIIQYITRVIGNTSHYYLLKFEFSNKNIQDLELEHQIMNKYKSFFNGDNKILNNVTKLKDSMITGEIVFYDVRYRLIHKKNNQNNNKYKLLIETNIRFSEYSKDTLISKEVKQFLVPKNIRSLSYNKKQKAIEKTFELIDIKDFLIKQCFQKKGNILKYTEVNNVVKTVTVSFGTNYVNRKDLFFLKAKESGKYVTIAEFIVVETFKGQSILKVKQGGKRLYLYLKKHKSPIITNNGAPVITIN